MKMTRILQVAAILCVMLSLARTHAQNIGPIETPQINATLYVGDNSGFYPSIQSGATQACSLANGARVSIIFGATPSDSIAAVVGGCTKAPIRDERVSPAVDYTWSGSAYVALTANGFSPTNSPANASNVVCSNYPASTYSWCQLTQDNIAPGYSINSFSGGQTLEIGQSVVNPTFTASYSSTPASASITNTDGTSSPAALTTPFTSGTITGTFAKTSQATTTFTLSAASTSGVTKMATQQFVWIPRTFGGIGAAGATSSVTASGTSAVLSNGATLASAGLVNSGSEVGKVFGPFAASGQKIYLLMSGGTHTFKDNATGFAFVFNSPTSVTFTNQFGGTVTMWLYESTNILTGTFSVLTVS